MLREGGCMQCNFHCHRVGQITRKGDVVYLCCECFKGTPYQIEHYPHFSESDYCLACLGKVVKELREEIRRDKNPVLHFEDVKIIG